jgi:apolipoprotein N-acyltransferase
MITYIYWAILICIAVASLIVIGGKLKEWKSALVVSLAVLIVGYGAYYFHFQQVFVKRYGGVMTVAVPEGELHLAATWKDDNLWVENYNPETNTCYFREYSRGNLLQGQVKIKNCNPLLRKP